MVSEKVSVIIFEGGQKRSAVEEFMVKVRQAVVLDNIEKMKAVSVLDDIRLYTNYQDLAEKAAALGINVNWRPRVKDFHFGKRLAGLVEKYHLNNVFYMGGAACPLIRPEELAFVGETLKREKNVVIVNNVQSPDMVAWSPGEAIRHIEPPGADNSLGYLLRKYGLRRVLIPNSAWINFDLDTPTDLMILARHPRAGQRTAAELAKFGFDYTRLDALKRLLATRNSEIGMYGRVGPVIVNWLNMHFMVRLRVFSEERGMKALGRLDRGEVTSLIGHFIDAVGFQKFFDYVAQVCDVMLFDTRVLFAHWKREVSENDRFNADIYRVSDIKDPQVRDFTQAAMECRVPVLLGGHSLVSGGLWALGEQIVAEQGRQSKPL